MVVQVWVGVGVEGYRCLSGCWCGRVQVCGWVLVWKGTGVWVGVGVEGYRCGCGRIQVFEWVWRGKGV